MLTKSLLLKFSSVMVAGSVLVGTPALIHAASQNPNTPTPVVLAVTHKDNDSTGHKERREDTRPDTTSDNDSDDPMIPAPGISGSAIISQAPVANSWAPARPAAGMGGIVFLNSFGNGAPLTIDLQEGTFATDNNGNLDTNQFLVSSDHLYSIPQATNAGMGRLQLALAPGSYNYTASVPNVGTVNGTFQVAAGHVMGLSFYGSDVKTDVNNHSDRKNDNSKTDKNKNGKNENDEHTTSSTVFTKLAVGVQDLTAQVR